MVEQVTVSEATATADSSGQGAVQIKFVTRSGSNTPTGSVYEYLRDTSLMTNSWQNEFRGLPKNVINWNQFGVRQGGPIVVPGLYDGRGKAFFFFNYEEFRLAVTAATNRTAISPEAQAGLFRYGCTAAGGCTGAVDVLALAARNGQIATVDPTVATMFSMINASVQTQGSSQQNVDRNTYTYSWQPPEFRIERFPFARVDVNLTSKQRLGGTFLYHKINSDPDIVNSGFSSYPDIPTRSTRYLVSPDEHADPALDPQREPRQRGRLGQYLGARLFLVDDDARSLRRRPQLRVPAARRRDAVALQRRQLGELPQRHELERARHAQLAEGAA